MKKIFCFVLALVLCLSAVVTAGAAEEDKEELYRDVFENYVLENTFEYAPQFLYREIYCHYAEESGVQEDVPEYVLAFAADDEGVPIMVFKWIGDYYFCAGGAHNPYDLGYLVYVPDHDKVYTLEEAYDMDIEGFEEAFVHLEHSCARLGDVDYNKELDIRDVTRMQKTLAGIDLNYVEGKYFSTSLWAGDTISDFNGDGIFNIKDATAIQKHLAGLEG